MIGKKDPDMVSTKTLTIIAEGVSVEGKIYSRGATRVDGNVKGEILSDKELIVGKEGKVEADARTTNATIAGSFNGEMIASGEVEITASGKFTGNLIQKDALLTIQKGGLFKGESIISDDQEIFKIEGPESHKSFIKPKRPVPETAEDTEDTAEESG
jgi:cytoskeletal protein CcmA (bactofilin family)